MSNDTWPIEAPKYASYLTFTPDTPHDVARLRFVEKYGVRPQCVFECTRWVWVGPVPDEGVQS